MTIVFDPASLRRSSGGAITGVVYFQIEGSHFPSGGWSDFVVVVAGWWIVAARAIAEGGALASLQFMDGPYRVELRKLTTRKLAVECVTDRQAATTTLQTTCTLSHLTEETLRLGNDVATACRARGWHSDDLDALDREIAAGIAQGSVPEPPEF